jgi:signal transduction histidine kinase
MRSLGQYLWPRSLYGQILLVAALALFVGQAVSAAMLFSGTRGRSIAETSTMIITRVANHIEREEATGVAIGSNEAWGGPQQLVRRDGRQRRRGPPVTITVGNAPLNIARFEAQDDITARARDFLGQADLELRNVRLSVGSITLLPPELRDPQMRRWRAARLRNPEQSMPRHAVLLSARLPDGRWIHATGLVRPTETASIIALLVQTLLLYAAVMIPLALVARRIAKPLARLNERVERVGLADEIAPMEADGPSDIRQLIDSFNAMQARVSTLLGEKDVMLGAIGHDLKTPLAALRVRIESVEDDMERDKMAATIDEMATILDDILTLARLGKSGEASQKTDIGALVGSVAEEYPQAMLTEPGTRIVADIRPVLLRRALRNLIGNAIIYGKDAAISVEHSSGQLRIVVEDSGPGIAPELIEPMFEPFARAETSRSRATGGSGLGLTISRAIARSHNGDVLLENRAEGGLRASLILPA